MDTIRACELIEEEGCPLFRQRSACSCDADSLDKLDAIGPWRLLTLRERLETGINHVYVLLVDAESEPAEPRYRVFAPLPGSHHHGELRGGVRAAELIEAGDIELLRIDFEGAVDRSSLPGDGSLDNGLARGWTLLCAMSREGPVCAAPMLSSYETPGELRFVAPVIVDAEGRVRQTVESGVAPSSVDLDLEFPGAEMRVLTRPTAVADLFR